MKQLYSYQWIYENEMMNTLLDMSYATNQDLNEALPYHMHFELSAKQLNKKGNVSLMNRHRIDCIIKKVKNNLKKHPAVKWVGERISNTSIKLYFYGQNEHALENLAYLKIPPSLKKNIKIINDESWQTYFNQIYPNTAQQQTVNNQKWITNLIQMGDNSMIARRISFHAQFPSEQDRVHYEQQAREAGFANGENHYTLEQRYPHGSVVFKRSPLLIGELNNLTTKLIYIVESNHGEYERWSASLAI